MYSENLITKTLCSVTGEDQKLAAQVSMQFRDLKLSGAFLIARGENVLARGYCGVSKIESRTPVNSESQFNIGSVTKQFTAYVLLDLQQEGRVELSHKASEYIEELKGSLLNDITIDQLIKMKSGLPYVLAFKQFAELQLSSRIKTDQELLEAIKEAKLEFTPGEKFSYSNVGYMLLGILISRVDKTSWSESLKKRIFNPLKMIHTTTEGDSPNRPAHLVDGLIPVDLSVLGNYLLRLPHWNYSMIKGAGGIVTTVDDLLLWNQHLTQRSNVDLTWAAVYFPSGVPNEDNYSFGWYMDEITLPTNKKVSVIIHSGEDPGYCALNIRIPHSDDYIMLTTNSDYCLIKNGALRPFLVSTVDQLMKNKK